MQERLSHEWRLAQDVIFDFSLCIYWVKFLVPINTYSNTFGDFIREDHIVMTSTPVEQFSIPDLEDDFSEGVDNVDVVQDNNLNNWSTRCEWFNFEMSVWLIVLSHIVIYFIKNLRGKKANKKKRKASYESVFGSSFGKTFIQLFLSSAVLYQKYSVNVKHVASGLGSIKTSSAFMKKMAKFEPTRALLRDFVSRSRVSCCCTRSLAYDFVVLFVGNNSRLKVSECWGNSLLAFFRMYGMVSHQESKNSSSTTKKIRKFSTHSHSSSTSKTLTDSHVHGARLSVVDPISVEDDKTTKSKIKDYIHQMLGGVAGGGSSVDELEDQSLGKNSLSSLSFIRLSWFSIYSFLLDLILKEFHVQDQLYLLLSFTRKVDNINDDRDIFGFSRRDIVLIKTNEWQTRETLPESLECSRLVPSVSCAVVSVVTDSIQDEDDCERKRPLTVVGFYSGVSVS